MGNDYFELEPFKPFSESLIWQLNRDFYDKAGIDAWSKGIVPHHMTSNSVVGKTYAELILAFLKDLAAKGCINETVYIIELGAGHGRLAFHILKHLQKFKSLLDIELPSFCYIISDIVDKNLLFFKDHPQLQTYYEQGVLDFAYFDGITSKEIHLQHANKTIRSKDLNQPIIAIGNYFFDTLPNDLFLVKNKKIAACSVALKSRRNPKEMNAEKLFENLEFTYKKTPIEKPFYPNNISNEILEDYAKLDFDTHLFFPQKSFQCLNNLRDFSNKGLMVLTMDKGFHLLRNLDKKLEPEVIIHGSFSLWVNFHAFVEFCKKKGDKSLFPSFSTFNLEIGCLFFLEEADTYQYTNAAYERFVNDFGPDDFITLKKSTYKNISTLTFSELIALMRLSSYDSTFFINILPRLKTVAKNITFDDRNRLEQTLHKVWYFFFNINEPYDLPYELGGFFYDLGFYEEALDYFEHSINLYGQKDDVYYNKALCYYQLRKDNLFRKILKEAKETFPESVKFIRLDELDLNAV